MKPSSGNTFQATLPDPANHSASPAAPPNDVPGEAPVEPQRQPDQQPLTLLQRCMFTVAHFVMVVLMRVLTLRGLYMLLRGVGTIEWLFDRRRRRRFEAALGRVLGRPPTRVERRRLAREYVVQSRCDKVLYLVFDAVPRERAAGLLTVVNRGALDRALANGRGVCMATSHLGSQHLAGMFAGAAGYKPAGIRAPGESALRRWVQGRWDRRESGGGRAQVVLNDRFPREIYRLFERGFLIGSSMDVARVHAPNLKTEEVTFFGERRPFLSGPLHIALRCRAPVLQEFLIPERDFRYRMEVLSLLADPEGVGDDAAAIREVMQAYAANVERYTRKYPHLISRL